jgi:hypothetical protein
VVFQPGKLASYRKNAFERRAAQPFPHFATALRLVAQPVPTANGSQAATLPHLLSVEPTVLSKTLAPGMLSYLRNRMQASPKARPESKKENK